MENQFWQLFRETGDPMCYLLYKAEVTGKTTESREKKQPPVPQGTPPATA